MAKIYENLKELERKDGEVEFQAEVSISTLEEFVAQVLARRAENFSMSGFRKGKVPLEIVSRHMDEMDLLHEASDAVLYDALEEISIDEKINFLGNPQIVITKIAPKNPLNFKIRFALKPEIDLPDYKKIGKMVMSKEESTEVGEQELNEAIDKIREIFGKQGKEGEDLTLPEINDDFVKQLGPFQNVEEFKAEIKKQILNDKKLNSKEAKRNEIVKKITEESKIKIPKLTLEQEFHAFKDDQVARLKEANLSLDDYLKEVKKTKEELESDERKMLEERIKISLILQEIREKEEITFDEKDVQINIMTLKRRYPDRKEDELRRTAEAISVQNQLFKLLEGDSETEST